MVFHPSFVEKETAMDSKHLHRMEAEAGNVPQGGDWTAVGMVTFLFFAGFYMFEKLFSPQ